MQTPFNKLEIGDNFASCIWPSSPRYFIFEIWHWIFAVPSTWWIFIESLEMKNLHSPLNHDWNKRLTIWVKWLVSDPFFEQYKTFFQPFPNFTFICIIWLFNLNLFNNPILWRLSHSVNSNFQTFFIQKFPDFLIRCIVSVRSVDYCQYSLISSATNIGTLQLQLFLSIMSNDTAAHDFDLNLIIFYI